LIRCLQSLPFNLPSLSNLSERLTCGVDGDGNLAIEDDGLVGFYESNQSKALQEIPQLNYTMEYITTYLQEISQRIR